MNVSRSRGAGAIVALGALALAGCASVTTAIGRPEGTILRAANTKALNSSFRVAFTGQIGVNLSGVTPPPGVTAGELSLIEAEINLARLTGVAQVESPTAAEVSFRLSPLSSQTWRVIYLNRSEYVSENGRQWYRDSTPASDAVGGLGTLKSQLESWGLELKKSAAVTKLGTSTIGGSQVEHLRTTIAGANLNQSMAGVLGDLVVDLGGQGAQLKADLPAIEALLQFTQVQLDSYVVTSTGQLARTNLNLGLNLNLDKLATLAPGRTDLPSGTASLTVLDSGAFSDYGADFNLHKPTNIEPGPAPTPSGLSGLLGLT